MDMNQAVYAISVSGTIHCRQKKNSFLDVNGYLRLENILTQNTD